VDVAKEEKEENKKTEIKWETGRRGRGKRKKKSTRTRKKTNEMQEKSRE
jgi:hypothetical protein